MKTKPADLHIIYKLAIILTAIISFIVIKDLKSLDHLVNVQPELAIEKLLLKIELLSSKEINNDLRFKLYRKYFLLGQAYQNIGDNQKARDAYDKSIKYTKDKTQLALIYYSIGSILTDETQYSDALIYFDKALELNPQMYDAYQNKAVIFRKMGSYQRSITICKEIIAKFPNKAKTHCSLGWAYELAGYYNEAITEQIIALQLEPKWDLPRLRLKACFSAARQTYSPALLKLIRRIDSELAETIEKSLKK